MTNENNKPEGTKICAFPPRSTPVGEEEADPYRDPATFIAALPLSVNAALKQISRDFTSRFEPISAVIIERGWERRVGAGEGPSALFERVPGYTTIDRFEEATFASWGMYLVEVEAATDDDIPLRLAIEEQIDHLMTANRLKPTVEEALRMRLTIYSDMFDRCWPQQSIGFLRKHGVTERLLEQALQSDPDFYVMREAARDQAADLLYPNVSPGKGRAMGRLYQLFGDSSEPTI